MERAILLVDDDPSVLHGLARALRHQPYRIYTATSSEEAMLAIKGRNIQVAVVDEHMPGMRGSELLAWMAHHCPEIVRIVLTGHPTIDTAIRAINEGRVYQFFVKPCNPVELGMSIRRAMEHKEVLEHDQEEIRRLMEDNKRQREEIQRCREDVMVLSKMIARVPLEVC